MRRARLLVLDDDPDVVEEVERQLATIDMTIQVATSGAQALRCIDEAIATEQRFDVVLVAQHLLHRSGVECACQRAGDARVVVMDDRHPADSAIEAMNLGFHDFISRPFADGELRVRIERAARARPDRGDGERGPLRRQRSGVIIGHSPAIKELLARIDLVARTDVTVALSGESGTGKEMVARAIHELSPRSRRPFVVVDCTAIPENLLESELFGHTAGAYTGAVGERPGLLAAADGGTLFLDEIGDMPLMLQAKMLRVLQSGEFRRLGDSRPTRVDIRVITATHRDLEQAVESGQFRTDLFYRINVFPVAVPPLRERRQDVPVLAHHFLLKHRAGTGKAVRGLSPAALRRLRDHDFPGNVRELENRVHHALVVAQSAFLQPEELALRARSAEPAPVTDLSRSFRELKRDVVATFERQYVMRVLRANRGNVAAAARQAGMDRKNLWSLSKKHGIDPNLFRNS